MKSLNLKDNVQRLRTQGHSYNAIANILGITKSSVCHLSNYKLKANKRKRGPKQILNNKGIYGIRRVISLLKDSGEKVNTTKIIRNSGLQLSKTTCWRYMNRIGYKYKKMKRRILLKSIHKENRIKCITEWFKNGINWNKVVFTDEKRFCLDGPDNWFTYMSKAEVNFHQVRPCEGGGVMVWLMMMPNGLLAHRIIKGKFNAVQYIDLLNSAAIKICKMNFGNDFIFQDDNSPIHQAKLVKKFWNENQINNLNWPSKSPDINIVEDAWHMISNIVYDGPQFCNKSTLEKSISDAINLINCEQRNSIMNLYDTYVSRLCKVLAKNGNLFNK